MTHLSPQWCLLAGLSISLVPGLKPGIKTKAKLFAPRFLQLSIILMGSALNFSSVLTQGLLGIGQTLISIVFVFILGLAGMRVLRIEKSLGLLITSGTAICGGSAIGALAPVIQAEASVMTISLSIIFLLNALSVFLFPLIGNALSLTQSEFGIWAALAIHDTSSVVAASSIFGKNALEVATTLKLTRALWIIPLTLIFSFISAKKSEQKLQLPWFIAGFVLMSLLFTFIPEFGGLVKIFSWISKQGFAVTLFLIGLSFDIKKISTVGMAPLIFGTLLWVLVSIVSLFFVLAF
jgi:uncharacterized integral membrane protein (TIGR00698 family)